MDQSFGCKEAPKLPSLWVLKMISNTGMNGPNSLAITVLVVIVADLMHHMQQPEEKSRIKATLPQVDLTPATAILKQGLLLLS